MIGFLGKILKVLIDENDKLNGITILGFNICKDNIIRTYELRDSRKLYINIEIIKIYIKIISNIKEVKIKN